MKKIVLACMYYYIVLVCIDGIIMVHILCEFSIVIVSIIIHVYIVIILLISFTVMDKYY